MQILIASWPVDAQFKRTPLSVSDYDNKTKWDGIRTERNRETVNLRKIYS